MIEYGGGGMFAGDEADRTCGALRYPYPTGAVGRRPAAVLRLRRCPIGVVRKQPDTQAFLKSTDQHIAVQNVYLPPVI